MGSQSHCIALHTRDLYPTAYLISGTLLPPLCIFEILISLHDHSLSRDLHPTPYHGISIPLHIRDLYPTSSLSYFISWGLNPIALHIRIFIPHYTSSHGLHPFHIMRSLSRCISQYLH